MDFSLTTEQIELRESVVRFAQRELTDDTLMRRDVSSEFSRSLWRRCADFGIQGLPVPEQYGGSGLDSLSTMIALEALGYACKDNGLLFSLNAQMWSCELPLLKFGREDQKQRYLPGLCNGSLIGVQAMTEPGSGSDAFGLRTTKADMTSPRSSSGLPTTPASATEGWVRSADSTSMVPIRWAAILIISSARPLNQT